MMQGLLKEHSMERSEQALIIAKSIAEKFTMEYKKSGVKLVKSEFYNLFLEVSYNALNLYKFKTDYTQVQKKPYLTAVTKMLRAKGYTFFLQNEANRMAVMMHLRMMCK